MVEEGVEQWVEKDEIYPNCFWCQVKQLLWVLC